MRAEASREAVRETYTQIAEHFDATRYMPWPEAVFFASTLEPGSLVADLGCGNGRNSLCLAEFGMRVVAVDFVQAMLDITRRKMEEANFGGRLTTVCCDVSKLEMQDASVDAVLYTATLHHLASLDERRASAREVVRILRPGGRALVGVWAREQERFAEALAGPPQPGLGEGDVLVPWTRQSDGKVFQRFVHLFARGELESLFEPGQIVESFSHADNHYVVVQKQ